MHKKTMGIIAGLLFSAHLIDKFYVPFWVVIACNTAMGLGTLAGGWRIVKTMGQRVAKLKPVDGFVLNPVLQLLFLINCIGNTGKYYSYNYRFNCRSRLA